MNIVLETSQTNDLVGPGKYNSILKPKTSFHVTGGSSMFLSKVQRSFFAGGVKKKSKKSKNAQQPTDNEMFKSTKGLDGNRFNVIK